MNEVQRIIKSVSILGAVLLAVVIFFSITKCVKATAESVGVPSATDDYTEFSSIFSLTETDLFGQAEAVNFYEEFDASEIENLTIEAGAESFTIKSGDVFSVEGKNVPEYFDAKMSGDTLEIGSFSQFFVSFNFSGRSEVIVTIPENMQFDNICIVSGSGGISVTDLNAESLEVVSGSGVFEFTNSTFTESSIMTGSGEFTSLDVIFGSTEMATGSGQIDIKNTVMDELSLDSGSGRVSIQGLLTGEIEIESESGKVYLTITGARENYSIYSDTGSGGFYVAGDKVGDVEITQRNEVGTISVESGSGRVSIEFE